MTGDFKEADATERRRARMVHQTGVAVFLLILGAALAGVLGKGPLSHSSAQSADGALKADYLRFLRYQGPVDLRIQIAAAATTNGAVQLRLSQKFMDEVEIERIDPEPESSLAGPEFFTHTIRVETNASAQIRVRFAASHFGTLAYEIGLKDGPTVRLRHFAFP
jgi:hypothetical protein